MISNDRYQSVCPPLVRVHNSCPETHLWWWVAAGGRPMVCALHLQALNYSGRFRECDTNMYENT